MVSSETRSWVPVFHAGPHCFLLLATENGHIMSCQFSNASCITWQACVVMLIIKTSFEVKPKSILKTMPLIDINKLLDEPMINPDKVYKVINLVIKHLNDRTILSMIKPITTEHKPLKYSVLPQCVPLPLPHPAWMRSLADCRHSLIN